MQLWITARAAGLGLLCMLSISAAIGMMASRREPSPSRRAVLQYLHRSTALISVALLALHVGAIVLDEYADVGVGGALVPFGSGYRPLAVALGTLSAYGLVATAALGLARSRFAASERAAGLWRKLHIGGAALWVLAVLHSLLAGTDTVGGWARLLVYACIAVVALAGLARSLSERRARAARPARRSSASLAVPSGALR